MLALFDFLYREYCHARLAEMRKQLLLWPGRHEVPEANCVTSNPDGAANRGHDPGDPQRRAGHGTPNSTDRFPVCTVAAEINALIVTEDGVFGPHCRPRVLSLPTKTIMMVGTGTSTDTA